MKKIYTSLVAVLLTALSFAQVPQGFNYQAVIRDISGNVIADQEICIRISLLQGSATSGAVYIECFTPITNSFGLVSLQIGRGDVQTGDFSVIDWSAGPYFIKVEIDESGVGSSFTELGVSQLLSVPYSQYASKAGNVFSGSWSDITDKPTSVSGYGIADGIGSSNIIGGIFDENVVLSGEGFNIETISEGYRVHFENTFNRIPLAVAAIIGSQSNPISVIPTPEYLEIYVSLPYNSQGISFIVFGDINNEDSTDETVSDIDNNTYNIVEIGSQKWIKENLRTTKYNDGTPISEVIDDTDWSNQVTGAYCWYNNDSSIIGHTYGALYNWYAVNNGNLCPTGWHVPSDDEWKELEMYLGMNEADANMIHDNRGVNEGGKLKISTFWKYPNVGATNETSFSGKPTGFRYIDGSYYMISEYGWFWTASMYDSEYAVYRGLYNHTAKIERAYYPRTTGVSVRCVQN